MNTYEYCTYSDESNWEPVSKELIDSPYPVFAKYENGTISEIKIIIVPKKYDTEEETEYYNEENSLDE